MNPAKRKKLARMAVEQEKNKPVQKSAEEVKKPELGLKELPVVQKAADVLPPKIETPVAETSQPVEQTTVDTSAELKKKKKV